MWSRGLRGRGLRHGRGNAHFDQHRTGQGGRRDALQNDTFAIGENQHGIAVIRADAHIVHIDSVALRVMHTVDVQPVAIGPADLEGTHPVDPGTVLQHQHITRAIGRD